MMLARRKYPPAQPRVKDVSPRELAAPTPLRLSVRLLRPQTLVTLVFGTIMPAEPRNVPMLLLEPQLMKDVTLS
jgi:hypothetical protein